MKKALAVLAGLLAVAYPASSWMLGRRVEAILDRQYQRLEGVPYVKVAERQYHRGLFVSQEMTTFELFGELSQPIRLTLRSRIEHGPVPGLSVLAAAVVDSELELDERIEAQTGKLFGANPPLTMRTVVGFDGGGTATSSSPAFTTALTDSGAGRPVHLAWQGLRVDLSFGRDLRRYAARGEAPGLAIEGGPEMRMSASGFRFDVDQERLFEDEPFLFTGWQRLSLDEVRMGGADGASPGADGGRSFLLTRLTSDLQTTSSGDFVDMIARLGAEAVQIDGRDYGPAHFDVSLVHLHARTMAKWNRALVNGYAQQSTPPLPGDAAALMAELVGPAVELLGQDAEIRLDRLSFVSPQGEALVSASLRLKDLSPGDLAIPLLLVPKIEAAADVAWPEALLGLGSAEAQARQARLFEALLAQDYIRREGGLIKSKLVARGGEITLNGHPFNPAVLAR